MESVKIIVSLHERGQEISPLPVETHHLLKLISNLFWGYQNNNVVDHPDKNTLLSDKKYGFRSTWSAAEVLTTIPHIISEDLNNKHTSRTIELDIPKIFDKVRQKGVLHNLLNFFIVLLLNQKETDADKLIKKYFDKYRQQSLI